ncbi:MAG: KOW domain-containing RNA-binding protein [Firmicutes bacterium]|nr:KOW domain-containing RNA-binding protein [Bacillota bacterium]
MEIGQVVFSKSGRDKGKTFIVIKIHENYVYLVDGKLRVLAAPKKKKLKHIQPTNFIADLTTNGRMLQDADIRKQLKAFIAKADW